MLITFVIPCMRKTQVLAHHLADRPNHWPWELSESRTGKLWKKIEDTLASTHNISQPQRKLKGLSTVLGCSPFYLLKWLSSLSRLWRCISVVLMLYLAVLRSICWLLQDRLLGKIGTEMSQRWKGKNTLKKLVALTALSCSLNRSQSLSSKKQRSRTHRLYFTCSSFHCPNSIYVQCAVHARDQQAASQILFWSLGDCLGIWHHGSTWLVHWTSSTPQGH